MRIALDAVVQDFIVSNTTIARSYFDLSDKIIDSLCDSHSPREAVLMRLLEQAGSVTLQYLDAHHRVLNELYSNPEERPVATELTAPQMQAEERRLTVEVPASVPSQAPGTRQAADAYEGWLREEISGVTGLAAGGLDLQQSFEALGLDSLSRVDLFDAMSKAFPEVKEQSAAFFDLPSPAALLGLVQGEGPTLEQRIEQGVLMHLVRLTGFTAADIDLQQGFESLGIDSLVRLDFFDLLSEQWSQLKAHGSALVSAATPQAIIEGIRQILTGESLPPLAEPPATEAGQEAVSARLANALTPLVEQAATALQKDTPFSQLGLDGFAREALCKHLAQACSASAFAGEALMSRRNPQEVVSLLTRMG